MSVRAVGFPFPASRSEVFFDGQDCAPCASNCQSGQKPRSYGYVGNITTEQGDAAAQTPDPNTGMSAWSGPGIGGYSIASFDQPSDTLSIVESWAADNPNATQGDAFYGSPWGDLFTGCDTYKLEGRTSNPPQSPSDNNVGTCGPQHLLAASGRGSGGRSGIPTKGHTGMGNYIFADSHANALRWGQIRTNDFWLFERSKPTQTFSP